ncbi:S41 family peptidase [Alkalicoccus urumqiensis]|uniref:Peptidase S41 n=1 Tax=Alkalicoccus urumqiensis TaxID=1548213 RepID=A0A2P6MH51_ALKUR|nr:S41 family peptidase [Alkalicoccus urumqiensis]PRO65607.1 peptidase S41 [Alkalicoccus urumqiensis]
MIHNKFFIPLIFVLALLIGAGGTFAWMTFSQNEQAQQQEVSSSQSTAQENAEQEEDAAPENEGADWEQLEQTFELIQESYVDDVESSELIDGAISGMIDTLDDPYSVFMNQSTAEQFMQSLESSFEGIGAEVSMENDMVTIVAPFRDSPAEEAGLRPNDQVVEVDGENIEGLSLYDAVLKIRGEKGTTVTLTIDRPGSSDLMDVDVVRDEIPIETVYSETMEEAGQTIGILEIRSFSEQTASEFTEQLEALEAEGIDGLVIDVRGNPGGYLQSVEDIGDAIIPGGEPVVQIEDSEGQVMQHVSSLEEEKEYPIVGLIDEGSASASEILAAALHEAGGYELVGETTFGKGTVQQTIPLEDGSQVKLTAFRWLTSAGNDINEDGVDPTVEVMQPDYFYTAPVDVEEPLVFDMLSDQVENVQIMLNGLGYDPGRTDGYFGEQTEAAVRSFQEANGLEASGEVDEETAGALQEQVIESVRDPENDRQLQEALDLIQNGGQ